MLIIPQLGCGTALPSLALFHWAVQSPSNAHGLHVIVSDYNPTVLQLVTLPNFILTWATAQCGSIPPLQEAMAEDGELDLTPDVLEAFRDFLLQRKISLDFVSGGWSQEFVDLVYGLEPLPPEPSNTCILGAETIYSPFALQAFAETILYILRRKDKSASAYVGAKNMYFGVGGSLDDFVANVQEKGLTVTQVRTENDGVRRGVVRCTLEGHTG